MNFKSKSHYLLFYLSIWLLNACNTQPSVTDSSTADVENATSDIVKLSSAQRQHINLSYDTMRLLPIDVSLRLNGKIDVPPQNLVSVSAPIAGYLKSTNLMPGMFVKKGQVIAQIEERQILELQEEFLIGTNKLKFLQKEFQRQLELFQQKAASEKVLQEAETNYKEQQIYTQALKQKLKLLHINPDQLNEKNIRPTVNIFAPITGYVSNVLVNIGKYVSPTDILFELVNPDDIHLNLTVFEKNISDLYIGQRVMAFTNNDTTKRYPCHIILIGKDITPERFVEVHCHFDQYDHTLLPGMYMNAYVQTTNQTSYTLPVQSIVRYKNKEFVFEMINDTTHRMIEVLTGEKNNNRVAILKPSFDNQKKYVTSDAYALLMVAKNKAEVE
jgi:RND family efflux transporter, MFP subunit